MARSPMPSPRRRRLLLISALAVTTLATALAACSNPTVPKGHISLLPAAGTKNQGWHWTSACPVGPQAADGCAATAPTLGSAQLTGNEWNLGATPGSLESVNMTLGTTGGLTVDADLSAAPPCTAATCLTSQANTWVRGYPSVLYGIDQCHAASSPPQSPALQLPARVDTIPSDLIARTAYVAQAAQVTYDVAYDLWLSPSDTKTPCQADGTVEVMVWTDYNQKALLPDSLKVATTTLPYAVDGHSVSTVWSVYVNNVFGGGHTQPWGGTVWLVPAAPTAQGTVTVDISAALTTVGSLLQKTYGWAPFANRYWLDTIAFGLEYGPGNADPYGSGPATFALDIGKYCLQPGSTVSSASC
jgi:hypothetical protein